MLHEKDLITSRLRFLFVGTLVIASLLLVWLFVSTAAASTPRATNANLSGSFLSTDMSDSPNIVSRSMFALANGLDRTTSSMDAAVGRVFKPIRLPHFHLAISVGNPGASIGHGLGGGLMTTTHAIGGGFAYVFHIPGNILGFVTHINIMSAVVRPADHDQVPVIDPNSPELKAALAALPASNGIAPTPAQANEPAPQWPIHGIVTTQFGVPEPPYQPIHTGLDISDGRRPGITPIRPFRPGRVIETVHSRLHLGNHVVIDHGNGVTSVYGHLNSISVHEGQSIDESTILGYEGTTGVSTGPHLHFEIRVNAQAVDPHKFINGQP